MSKSHEKLIRKLLVLVLLLIVSPLVLSLAFRVHKIYTDASVIIAYLLLLTSLFLILFTVYFGLKTFKLLLSILFNN